MSFEKYDEKESVVHDGDLDIVREVGENSSAPTYQEASGAPVEHHSPLGYAVQWISVIGLNVGMMVGTGVFVTPATILKGVGSVGLSLLYWLLGFFVSASALAVLLELSSYFPSRSGAEVVYLEQAYPRPKYLLPTTFAVISVLLSFSSGNAIVLATYLFRASGHVPTPWQLKGVAVSAYTITVLLLVFHNKFSIWLVNVVTFVKIITLIFITITGFVVLGGHTRVKDPHANFRNSFEGTSSDANGITNALVKIMFAYAGYQNAFNLVNETKNPIKVLKRNAPISLIIVGILYVGANIAYFAAVPKKELVGTNQIAASLFFAKVFGSGNAARGLNLLISLSSFGNLTAVLIGQSRIIREIGRQGVLPFPRFWASTKPFGTPLGPYALKWALTVLMILAPPAGDAFNFIVDLQSYPNAVFVLLMTIGVYIIRYRRRRLGLPRAEFEAWHIAVIFSILVNLFLLIMPWYPPATGRYGGDVTFWYATYCVVGLAFLGLCGLYYYVWIHLLPSWGKYQIRQEVIVLDESGATTHRLLKVPNDQLAEFDRIHDVSGKVKDASGKTENLKGDSGSENEKIPV